MAPRGRVERNGAGALGQRARRVEHLEDPLEGHEGGQHVDPQVREADERVVDPVDQQAHGDQIAQREAAADHHLAADPVHGGHADGADDLEAQPERPAHQRAADADLPHPVGLVAEAGRLVPLAAEERDELGAGDAEALGHLRVHGRVELHALAGDRPQGAPHPLGADQEERQHRQGQDRRAASRAGSWRRAWSPR